MIFFLSQTQFNTRMMKMLRKELEISDEAKLETFRTFKSI